LSRERKKAAEAETVCNVEGNTSGAAMRGAGALPRSETLSRTKGSRRNLGDLSSPATAQAITGRDGKSRRRSRRGRGEESDGCIVPVKPRTKPTSDRWRRWWREGGRSKERRVATHVPDTAPDLVCHRSCEPTDRRCMGRPSPELRSRSTFDRSPVRESRTPGSARGGRGNPVPYRHTRVEDPQDQIEDAVIAQFALRPPQRHREVREDKCDELRPGQLHGNRCRGAEFCHIAHPGTASPEA
jgi:hypothetical protein